MCRKCISNATARLSFRCVFHNVNNSQITKGVDSMITMWEILCWKSLNENKYILKAPCGSLGNYYIHQGRSNKFLIPTMCALGLVYG